MLKIMDPSTLLPDFSAEHATDAALQAELAELFARLSVLAEHDDSGLARGRARLLGAVAESGERFAPLFGKLMQFFDLSADALRALFIRAANEGEWQAGPLPWVSLFHLQGGPRVAALDTGLVRLKKGTPFPRHRHTGAERVLILEGGYHDHEQRFYGPGAVHEMPQGSEHSLQMNAERDVLLAVILSAEIQVISG